MPALTGKRVVVTGGAGFIGSHLVDRIVRDRPAAVVVVDNFFLGRDSNLADARRAFDGLTIHRVDAGDVQEMRDLVARERIDVLFNLAVVPLESSLDRPMWNVNMNLNIAVVACELLREGRYETLVHFSSSEAYGTARDEQAMGEEHPLLPMTPYAASKAAGDLVVLAYRRTFGIDATIIRPFNNFGPRQNAGSYAGVIPIFIQRLLRREPLTIHGDGLQTRDFLFVRETADAAVRAYETPATRGLVLNVASGVKISVNELARAVADVMGVEPEIVHGPDRPGDVRRHLGDVSLARQLIRFKPTVSLRDGLRETIAWYQDALAASLS